MIFNLKRIRYYIRESAIQFKLEEDRISDNLNKFTEIIFNWKYQKPSEKLPPKASK